MSKKPEFHSIGDTNRTRCESLWLPYTGFFKIWIQSTVDNGGIKRGRSVAVGVSDMLKVTCDT